MILYDLAYLAFPMKKLLRIGDGRAGGLGRACAGTRLAVDGLPGQNFIVLCLARAPVICRLLAYLAAVYVTMPLQGRIFFDPDMKNYQLLSFDFLLFHRALIATNETMKKIMVRYS
jgi:hypothetical protein